MSNKIIVEELNNRLLREKLGYDVYELQEERLRLFEKLNKE